MFRTSRTALVIACALVAAGCSKTTTQKAANSPALKTEAQKFGYSVGYDLGQSMRPMLGSIDVKALELGIEQGSSGKEALISAKKRQQIKIAMIKKLRAKEAKDRGVAAKKNAVASKEFLAKIAKQSGVKTTADGLEYKIDKKGSGVPPTIHDSVTVNYRGTLPDGTVFDSSYARKQPLTFAVKDVIPGWVEGLQLMKPGSTYTFYVPAKLAYGERGAGPKIGPNQALIFQVHLIKVIRKEKKGNASK